MTSLSRNFIAANNFYKLSLKMQLKNKACAFRRMIPSAQKGNDDSEALHLMIADQDTQISDLKAKLKSKGEDLLKMETMFKEYASWRQKLEMIEEKMKQEVEYWKKQAQNQNAENEKTQKELLQLSKEQMSKASLLASKETEIQTLRDALEKNGDLQTVEEALCPQCKNSMEESIVVQKDMLAQAD